MQTHLRRVAVLLALLGLSLAGCSSRDGLVSPPTGPQIGAKGQGMPGVVRQGSPGGNVGEQHLFVSKTLGPQGGVIAVGRITVRFPAGSLPGLTTVSLTAWSVDDVYYFTVEPRNLTPTVPVQFSYLVGEPSEDTLSYNWNDGGWREPMPSWLSEDGTLLFSEAGFLGEFCVAPVEAINGRAGW
jgi:hypothetical protein